MYAFVQDKIFGLCWEIKKYYVDAACPSIKDKASLLVPYLHILQGKTVLWNEIVKMKGQCKTGILWLTELSIILK